MKGHNSRLALDVMAISLLAACSGGGSGGGGANRDGGEDQPSLSPPPPLPSLQVASFSDATAQASINYQFSFVTRDFSSLPPDQQATLDQLLVASIGGAAAGDYDGDDDIDLFITRGDSGPNLLYRNEGNLAFVDVAAAAGLAYTKSQTENYAHRGPTFADIDGDSDLDLFMGGLFDDPSLIYRNNGDGTFSDATAGSGIEALPRNNLSAAFGDYDLDGDLDLFVSHWGTPRNRTTTVDTQHLWRNDSTSGNIVFQSVSPAALISPGILTLADPRATNASPEDHTFTPTFARLNDDLYPDILSVADYNESMVFINNREGTFTNATDVGVIVDDYGMGSAVGDYDNDGDLDWFVSSIYSTRALGLIGNRLYRNDAASSRDIAFTDVSSSAHIDDGGWGWGACFLDFENDGDLDIYQTNGWPQDQYWGDYSADRSRAFVSDGAGTFANRAPALGLDDAEQGRGVVCADFDNDGDTDILLLHMNTSLSASLWRNDTSGNNYLRVKLRGLAPNTEAVGARIWARTGETEQMREIMVGSNFISQNPTVQVFGLGAAASVDELRIEWPNGEVTTTTAVAANQTFEAGQAAP